MPTPIALVGTIGAGKTTTARALAKHYDYTYLGADYLRVWLTGDPSNTTDTRVWSALAQAADEHVHNGIVLDSTGLALAYRQLIHRLDCFTVRLEVTDTLTPEQVVTIVCDEYDDR